MERMDWGWQRGKANQFIVVELVRSDSSRVAGGIQVAIQEAAPADVPG